MSWLYTVVFAGLVFSSDGDQAPQPAYTFLDSPPAVESLGADETEKFEQSYPLTANGRVRVSNINGSITVEAWDRNEVKLEYTKIADTKERLADVEIKIDSRADYFSVETEYPNSNWKGKVGDVWKYGGKLSVEFRLMVPRTAVLNEIETVNGAAAVSNFTNTTRVSAVNGSVKATNLRGAATLSTVNGEVVADFDRLDTGSKISLNTVNGSVRLLIPSDANATVRADSLNGNITNDFGLPVRKGKYVGRDMYGRLGSGGVDIKMDSVNGGLSIGRKNDGKSPSPATNLLPQKQSDDDDWDTVETANLKSAKIDKEIAKAVKEGTKASKKAMADVQGDLARLGPEISAMTEGAVKAIAAESVKLEGFQERLRDFHLTRVADAMYFPSVPRIEKKSETFAVKGVPLVSVTAKGSSVIVRGWDRSEIEYRVTQFTDPRNRSAIDLTESHTDSSLTLKVSNPSHGPRGGNFSDEARRMQIEIFVPHKSNLKIDANGEIRIEGVSGDVQLTGSDESVNVRDGNGKLRVTTSDGIVRVIGFRGEVDANTSDATINLEGDFTKLGAQAGSGVVTVTLPEGASADVEATGSEIEGDGITLTKLSGDETRGKYRIGKGGSPFKIVTDGHIRIRGIGTLKDTF